MNAPPKIPKADTDTISKFLYMLFAPDFVHAFPDAWIEIVFIRPDGGAWPVAILCAVSVATTFTDV